jgi:hypothetical protein
MMMTHTKALKTHPLLATHVRSVHSISFGCGLQTTKHPEGRNVEPPEHLNLGCGRCLLLVVDGDEQVPPFPLPPEVRHWLVARSVEEVKWPFGVMMGWFFIALVAAGLLAGYVLFRRRPGK